MCWAKIEKSCRVASAKNVTEPRHDLALGSAIRSRTEPSVPPEASENKPVVACGRDVVPRRWQVDLFISRLASMRPNAAKHPNKTAVKC
jgi:hypothetical protein